MTTEEKQLLLKDLCARAHYGVKCSVSAAKPPKTIVGIIPNSELVFVDKATIFGPTEEGYNIELVKLYLRPLSSMTEEEKLKLVTLYLARDKRCRKDLMIKETEFFLDNCWYVQITYKDENDEEVISTVYIGRGSYIEEIDWLNAHHFDYRELIKKGLAFEALEGMYN